MPSSDWYPTGWVHHLSSWRTQRWWRYSCGVGRWSWRASTGCYLVLSCVFHRLQLLVTFLSNASLSHLIRSWLCYPLVTRWRKTRLGFLIFSLNIQKGKILLKEKKFRFGTWTNIAWTIFKWSLFVRGWGVLLLFFLLWQVERNSTSSQDYSLIEVWKYF